MRHTIILHSASGFPSFWKRSLDEFKKLSRSAIKLDALNKPQGPLVLWDFSQPQSVQSCIAMSDEDIGGYSSVNLEHVPATATEPAHARFTGNISNKLPEGGEVQRTGYAAWRTRAQPPTIFGKSLWDVERYSYLALRVKSDGRKYKVNIQTDSLEVTDIHQHRLYTQHPHTWETVLIRWQDFVRTNSGLIVEPQSEMLFDQVRTIGVGLTDRLAGPFEFHISKIWATNGQAAAENESFAEDKKEFNPKKIKLAVGAVPKKVGVEERSKAS